MAKNSEGTGLLEALGSLLGAFVTLVLGIEILKWLWGGVLALLSWIDGAVSRLFQWILDWPFFMGYVLLIGFVLVVVLGVALVVAELLLEFIWPFQFEAGVEQATKALQGRAFLEGKEVVRLRGSENCNANARTAAVRFQRCRPTAEGKPELGIELDELPARTIKIEPTEFSFSNRLRTIRQPVTVFRDALVREGLGLLERDGVEAKAWQAVIDSLDELQRLAVLRETVNTMVRDTEQVLAFSEDNELLSPTRQRSKALAPRLARDIGRIDTRMRELRRFGYKLYEFLNIPRSLRSASWSDDIEESLLSQRGLSDELFDDIALIEKAYGELMNA